MDRSRHSIEKITCDNDHCAAMAEVEELRDARPGSEEWHYRETLLALIAAYEAHGKPKPARSPGT